MASWEWIALGLVFLVLVQLLAIRYARKMQGEDEGNGPRPTPGPRLERGSIDTAPRRDGGDIVCGYCGARNRPGFTYCRECVNPLA